MTGAGERQALMRQRCWLGPGKLFRRPRKFEQQAGVSPMPSRQEKLPIGHEGANQ
jgi:hypothetical protein